MAKLGDSIRVGDEMYVLCKIIEQKTTVHARVGSDSYESVYGSGDPPRHFVRGFKIEKPFNEGAPIEVSTTELVFYRVKDRSQYLFIDAAHVVRKVK